MSGFFMFRVHYKFYLEHFNKVTLFIIIIIIIIIVMSSSVWFKLITGWNFASGKI
jgi:hypothetical protein